MKRNKAVMRLLAGFLLLLLTFCGTCELTFAHVTNYGQTIVVVDEVNDKILEETTEDVLIYTPEIEEFSISGESTLQNTLQNNSKVCSIARTGLQPVSIFSLSFEPYKNMCLIFSKFPNGDFYSSSGIMVGKNVVLLSAHGVYRDDCGGEANHITIFIGAASMDSSSGSVGWKKTLVLPKSWVEKGLSKSDWALIVLQNEYESYQKIGYAKDYTQVMGRSVTTIGYPADNCTMSFSCGEITGTTDNKWDEKFKGLWKLSTEVKDGMSGGPVIDDNTGVVIGLINGIDKAITHETVAVPLTEFIVNTIKQFRNN